MELCFRLCLSVNRIAQKLLINSLYNFVEWLDTVQCCFRGSSANFRPNFYSMTLCVSALNAVARCPSVWLAGTFVHSVHTAEDIVKLLSRHGSPIILVLTLSAGTQFQAMAQNTRRVGEFCNFYGPITRFL